MFFGNIETTGAPPSIVSIARKGSCNVDIYTVCERTIFIGLSIGKELLG
jgi:hypothetical protein